MSKTVSEIPFAALSAAFFTLGLMLNSLDMRRRRIIGSISAAIGAACLIIQILRWSGAL